MNKERFCEFIMQTKYYPYFGANYDMNMWVEDYKEIEKLIESQQKAKPQTNRQVREFDR